MIAEVDLVPGDRSGGTRLAGARAAAAAAASPARASCRPACRRAPSRRAHRGAPARPAGRAERVDRRPCAAQRGTRARSSRRGRRRPARPAASSAPRSHSVRRMFVVLMLVAQDGREVLEVAGSMQLGAGDLRLRGAAGEQHVDRLALRPRDAPQERRRAMRRHRVAPGGHHGRADRAGRSSAPSRSSGRHLGGRARAARARWLGTTSARGCRRARTPGGSTSPWCSRANWSRRSKVHALPGCRRQIGKGNAADIWAAISPAVWRGSRPEGAVARIPPRWTVLPGR